jgi:transketolase
MTEDRSWDVAGLKRRANLVRQHIMTALAAAGAGHVGGSLSAADILTALYFQVLKIDPARPRWEERDRFILSKGHACAALCAVLAERGYFPVELLSTFNQLDSPFSIHPDMRSIKGVDVSTGSLGHGLSMGVGMALAGRTLGKDCRVYVLLGDGELCEGTNWEAAMAASHYGLERLIAIVDRNGLMVDGPTEEVMRLEPLAPKWIDFGWSVREIDGHDMEQILRALTEAPFREGRPSVIIAHTIKGKGVSFAENRFLWHSHPVDTEAFRRAMEELRSAEKGAAA